MNIKGQGHSLTLVRSHSDSTFSNFFSLETAGLIETKFDVELPWDGGKTVCSNIPGHMTNMLAMLVYGKNLKNLLIRNQKFMTLKVGMRHRILKYYQVYSNDDPGLTLAYFTARSNLVPYAFGWGKR